MYPTLEEAANQFLAAHNGKYKIVKGYGMTEVNGSIGRTLNNNNPIGSVGVPFAHSSVKICDPETGDELKYNEVGEIYMSGPSVMLGYYNKPEETVKIKVQDKNDVFWIKSGDLGYMTEDGNLFIKGRIKRMIIRHDGFKVFPSVVEDVVSNNFAIEQCCVVGTADTSHSQGSLPVVYAVLKQTYKGKENQVKTELESLCRKELPEYAQPAEWYFVSSLPLTPIGKIDYRALEGNKKAKQ